MNKEQQELVDEAYKNFVNTIETNRPEGYNRPIKSKEEFIFESKINAEFSNHWGLKIEEIILSTERRYHIWFNNNYQSGMERYFDVNNIPEFDNPYYDPTPTKIITITYNNKTILSHE
jgi:hypothetical protein